MITRMRALKLLLVVAGVFVFMLSVASVAMAEEGAPDSRDVTRTHTDVAPSSRTPGYQAGRDIVLVRWYMAGQLMFWYSYEKYYEYNGTRVNNIQHSIRYDVTGLGKAFQWKWDGITSKGGGYRTWGGSRYGSHWSYRTGQFSETIGPLHSTRHARIDITCFANGTETDSIQ